MQLAGNSPYEGSAFRGVFSSDDQFFACADSGGTIRLWEVPTGRLRGTLPGTTNLVKELWFPGGAEGLRLGIQRSSETFRFWDLQVDRELEALPKNVQRVRQTLENGLSLSLLHDELGRVRIESVLQPTNDFVRVNSALPLSDCKRMILGGERHITVWDMETGRLVATLEGHGGWVTGLALSADGRRLASAANDGTLKLWNLALRKEVLTFPTQVSPYTKVAFAPDGNSIAVVSFLEDRLVRLFHAPSFKEIEEAEARQLRDKRQP